MMTDQEQNEVPQYIRKPKTIIQDKRLTTTEGDYLALIGGLQNAEGCFASNGWFADYFGVELSTAKTIIKRLREKGFIICFKRQSQGGKITRRYIEIVDKASRNALLESTTESQKPQYQPKNDGCACNPPTHEENSGEAIKPQYKPENDGCACNPPTSTGGLQTAPQVGYKSPPGVGYKLHPINNIYKQNKNKTLSLAELFLKYRQQIDPNRRADLQAWGKVFDQLVNSGHDPQVIRKAIRWISRAECWWYGKSNTESPERFAKNFQTIRQQMQDEGWIDKSCSYCGAEYVRGVHKESKKTKHWYCPECKLYAYIDNGALKNELLAAGFDQEEIQKAKQENQNREAISMAV